MELIASQPGFRPIAEPFDLRNPAVRKDLGIEKWHDLCNLAAEAKIKNYIRYLFDCRYSSRFKHPMKLKHYRPLTHRLVLKINTACEDRINWCRDNFNSRIVYLIRHPIAVSLSRSYCPRLEAFIDSDYRRHFTTEQIRYAEKIIGHGGKLEQGVLSWCFQNMVPLKHRTPDWCIVTYEQLVSEPDTVIDHMANLLHLPDRGRMKTHLLVPSNSSKKSDQQTQRMLKNRVDDSKNHWLIEKWREKVSPEEERNLMEIVESFGIDAYRFGSVLPSDSLWVR
jgi:hypothetical protein